MSRTITALVITSMLALPVPESAPASSPPTEQTAKERCSQTRPVWCIRRAAIHRRVSFGLLKRRAWCESRFDPYAVGGPNVGLFQFNRGTWAALPVYSSHSPFSAKWSSLAAGWMQSVGRGGEWACQ